MQNYVEFISESEADLFIIEHKQKRARALDCVRFYSIFKKPAGEFTSTGR
jgi:hypothetical protein